jgi:hypothetical protein
METGMKHCATSIVSTGNPDFHFLPFSILSQITKGEKFHHIDA